MPETPRLSSQGYNDLITRVRDHRNSLVKKFILRLDEEHGAGAVVDFIHRNPPNTLGRNRLNLTDVEKAILTSDSRNEGNSLLEAVTQKLIREPLNLNPALLTTYLSELDHAMRRDRSLHAKQKPAR